MYLFFFFFFSSRRRHTRSKRDWSSDVCSSDLELDPGAAREPVIFGTESLGGKVAMDALGTIWNEHRTRGAAAAFRQRAAAVRTVFMLANQLPLMNLAAPGASLRDVLAALGDVPGGEARTVVAFSDPNDLLSYRLNAADVGVPGTRLLNIAVS